MSEQQPAGTVPPVDAAPPVGTAPPIDPTMVVWAVPPVLALRVRRPRPWLRTALRWTVAVVVCAAVGTGTAFAVMAPRRTDVPGLATPADSRYTFPALTLPPLPVGSLPPHQARTAVTDGSTHAVDLRKLLLPEPLGAKPVSGFLPDSSGWLPIGTYTKAFTNSTDLTGSLHKYGLRHIAARAWTGPDGVRTEIYLLGFRTGGDVYARQSDDLANTRPAGTSLDLDDAVRFDGLPVPAQATAWKQSAAAGRPAVRMAVVVADEVEAFIVMRGPKAVPLVNFQQVVTLQSELLEG